MRKLILVLVFITVFIIKSECQLDSSIANARIEMLEKESSVQNQQIIDLKKTIDSLQIQINQSIDGKKKFDWALVLTSITILISVMVYKREVSFRNVSFVTESNKMKIADPTLWAFYDTYKPDYNTDIVINQSAFQMNGIEEFDVKSNGKLKVSGSGKIAINGGPLYPFPDTDVTVQSNDKIKIEGNFALSLTEGASMSFKGIESKKLQGKIRAYCYFKLNSFELVFNYNQLTGASNTVWEDYMINSMIDSSSFYDIAKKESVGYLYNKKYREKLKDLIAIADLCKAKEPNEINRIIESKNRLILAYRSGLIKESANFSSIQNYLN